MGGQSARKTRTKAKGDFLGYIRVRVNRNNALHSSVSVELHGSDHYDHDCKPCLPPGTIARLYLHGSEFFLEPVLSGVPVEECVR